MKNLKAKLRKKEGFTLIEMLIVVAIIAILIAISIPLVGNALERARQATDAANERAAKAEITIMYLNSQVDSNATFDASKTYVYDAASGKMLDPDDTTNGTPSTKYGQCTTHGHRGQYLYVKYDDTNHEVLMKWGTSKPTDFTNATLCSKTVGNVT